MDAILGPPADKPEPTLRDIWFKFCVKNNLCSDPFENRREGEDSPRNVKFVPNPKTFMPDLDGIPYIWRKKELNETMKEVRKALKLVDLTRGF